MGTGSLIPAHISSYYCHTRNLAGCGYLLNEERYVNMYTHNRAHLLDSTAVDISTGPNMVRF